MDISELALRAQVAWFRGLAASGFPQTSAGEGFAVSTGLASNTENGAAICPPIAASPRPGAVFFPSPDGYHLHHSLGFDLAPVHPNRWFYLR